MKSDANHSKKLFSSYECFSDARASWEEPFVTRSLPIDCSSNGLVWRLQFPAQTFPSFHHSVYFHFHIKNPIKFSIDTIHYFDFWQYIFSPEINHCLVISSITFGKRCHATSVYTRWMLTSQWLITFWSFGKSLEREAKIVKTIFSQWLCKIFWEGNLLLPTCIHGRAYDRHQVWWQLIHYYTFLIRKHIPTMKLDSRLFQFTFARNCQISKRPWLRLLLPADISRQLLRPGPLFFKSELYHYVFDQSFVLLNVDLSLVFFAWQKLAVLEVNYLKWRCLKRKNVTTVDGQIKCNCYWWPHFDVEAKPI